MTDFDLNSLVRANVRNLKPYSSARDEFKTDGSAKMVFLDANENPNENGLNRYPDPQQRELKKRLSEIKNVPTEQILLGNGSDEVLDLIYRAFCEPGKDNVITLPPTYGMYKVLADINNVENREVLLNHEFQPDVTAILGKVDDHTKLIFICSPNNPSGNLMSRGSVERILQEFNGLVIIDEAYIDFAEEESWSLQLSKYPNLIVTQTFSKALAHAAIRLGILFASEEIIQILNKIKPPYNVNELTQQKALEVLNNEQEINSEVIDIKVNKESLIKELLEINFVSRIYKSDANFLLIQVDNANKRYDDFLQKGIVLRNRSNQPLCENCLRITIGTQSENDQLIKTFKELENE